MTFMSPLKNFFSGYFRHRLTKCLQLFDRFGNILMSLINLRIQARDDLSMPRDGNRFPPLHGIEERGEFGFGFGSLNFAHDF